MHRLLAGRRSLQGGLGPSLHVRSMSTFKGHWKGHNLKPLKVRAHGIEIINQTLYNKGLAFSPSERDRLNLRGLLPPRHLSFDIQIKRIMSNLRALKDDMAKNVFLTELQDRNTTLFHRVLVENMEELLPIVYTPTVGRACLEYGKQFRRPRGMYFSTQDRGEFASMVHNWPGKDVQVIVVTDGSRILGLGDLGAYGMPIPQGKLALYCAAGGIAPHRVLPCVLDCGTNNKALLADPYYMGVAHARLRGTEFYEMVDEFIDAIKGRWPNVLLQFEDFSSDVAYDLLETYRSKLLCFNDDIQGTGSVTLAGILSALRNKGKAMESLKDERILIAGAGSAGIGVASMLLQGMVEQGMARNKAARSFWVCDKDGLLTMARGDKLSGQQKEFARDDMPEGMSLLEVAKAVQPTVLLGLSAVKGLFTEELVKEVAKHTPHPFILPLSNPTSVAECTASEAYLWTEGRAIFASGSPFDPVTIHGKTYTPSQSNNMLCFPGIGLGASVAGAKMVTNKMLYAASEAVADSLTEQERAEGRVFPRVRRIREVSLEVAVAVAHTAITERISRNLTPADIPNLEKIISKRFYDPVYVPLVEDVYRSYM